MTKNEALKACIDGKKVRLPYWAEDDMYMYFYGSTFRTKGGDVAYLANWSDVGWQIVSETFDFATAWKAVNQGKGIQSKESGKSYYKVYSSVPLYSFEIDGEWLILD